MILKGYIKYISIFFLVCTCILAGCSKEEVAISAAFPVEVNVTQESATKITTNGTTLFWAEGDKLALFAATGNNTTTASATLELNSIDAGSSTGKFKGEISISAEPEICYFTYPYTVVPAANAEKVSAQYSYSAQDGLHKPFLWGKANYPGNGVMNCNLQHIGGMLYLTNIPAGVTAITIKGNSAENLSPVDVNLSNGEISVGSEKEFDVNISGTTAYICMPPVNFAKGFSIIFHSASGDMFKSYSSDGGNSSGYNFTAGTYITINVAGTFTPFNVTANAAYSHTVSGGFLTGTNVTVTPALQGAPAKITKWRADLVHSDGTTIVRTVASNNNFGATQMSVVDNWTYIPSGTYTLKSYYTQYNGSEIAMPESTITVAKASEPVNISTGSSIAHNYSGGNLTGTTVKVTTSNNSPLPVESWSATLVNSDATTVRTTVGNTSFGTVTFPGTEYLSRQKSYTLTVTCVVKGDVLNCAAPSTFNAPNPTGIKVNVSGNTTYDYYLASNLSAANTADYRLKIRDISAGSSGYDASLSSYATPVKVYCNGTDITGTTEVADMSLGQHTLQAKMTFDGIEFSGSVTKHVTGLPYSISFDGNSNPTGWTLGNNGENSGYLTLQRGDAYAITPAFHLPANINVSSTLVAYAYGGSIYSSYKPTVAIHASESGTNSSADTTLSGKNALPITASFSTITDNSITLTPSVKKVCIFTSGTGSNWSVGGGDMGVVCKEFSTVYR
ncbi:MAG: hypothetical protein IKT74_04150 [Bacteroidales bacterium]|nr:hypothetical protein [Bacteroidales bacterium]